jgi:hypothetical protein
MMDERRQRALEALRATMQQPLFDEAVEALRRDLATEIADCSDYSQADALRAQRVARGRLRGQLQAYLNELTMELPNV